MSLPHQKRSRRPQSQECLLLNESAKSTKPEQRDHYQSRHFQNWLALFRAKIDLISQMHKNLNTLYRDVFFSHLVRDKRHVHYNLKYRVGSRYMVIGSVSQSFPPSVSNSYIKEHLYYRAQQVSNCSRPPILLTYGQVSPSYPVIYAKYKYGIYFCTLSPTLFVRDNPDMSGFKTYQKYNASSAIFLVASSQNITGIMELQHTICTRCNNH